MPLAERTGFLEVSPLRKITWVLIGSSCLALTLLIFYLHYSLQNSAIGQWVDHKSNSAIQLASWIDNELAQAQSRLEYLSRQDAFRLPPDSGLIERDLNGIPEGVDIAKREVLDWLLHESHEFSVLFVLLPNGDHYLSHPFSVQQRLEIYNLSQRPYIRAAVESRKPVISDSFVGADGVPAVAIDIPILNDNGEISSHLGGVFHLSSLKRLIKKSTLYSVGETAYLLDRRGRLISQDSGEEDHTKALLESSRVSPFVSRHLTEQGAGSYSIKTELVTVSAGDGKQILLQVRLTNGWTLGVFSDLKSVLSQFTPGIWRTAALAAVLLMVISGMGIFGAGRIGLRWQAAERIVQDARDNLEIRISERTGELAEKEAHLRLLMSSIPDLVWMKDENGVYLYCNSKIEELFGANEADIIGRTDFDFVDAELAAFFREKDKLAMTIGGPSINEERVTFASDGHEELLETIKTPVLDSQGKTVGVLGIGRDITARKHAESLVVESEAKFHSIFQSTVVGMIVVIDGHGIINEWNRGAEQVFGYSESEAVGKSLTMLMPDRFKEAHIKGLAQAVENGGVLHSGVTHELTGLRKNGEEFPLELTLGSWKWEGELYFSAIILDISGRKLTEKTLRRSQKMDAIGQLTGGIAHDFNNILGIIIGNLDLLSHGKPANGEVMKRVDTISKSAQRAATLTKQLLSFSSNQAARTAVIDINRVIGEMENLISRSVTPEVMVDYRLAENQCLTKIDIGDFENSLLNLIINSRDAMPDGGWLTLKTGNRTLDDSYCTANPGAIPGKYVYLSVSDSGKGISPENQEHIFEPFFTTKAQGKGTGLGLSMVFGFIKRSKGYIRVQSGIGTGTVFELYLPYVDGVDSAKGEIGNRLEALPRGDESILVVDDETGLLELAQESLQSLGYQVFTATSGAKALAVLAEEPSISLLFCDVVMPGGMNGYEVAKQVAASRPDLKVLLTSGYAKRPLAETGESHLNAGLLDKPYRYSEMVQRVRALLDGKE